MITELKVKSESFSVFHYTFKDCLLTLKQIESIRNILEAAAVHDLKLTFDKSKYDNDFIIYADEWGLYIKSRSESLDEFEEELEKLENLVLEKMIDTRNIECIKINQNEYSPDIINFLLENFNVKFIN